MLDLLRKTGALLEGHFLLSSGRHSDKYIQCAKLLSHPEAAKKAVKLIAEKLVGFDIDTVVGPAMGGIVVSYELASQIGAKSIFTERENNVMTLRRGFDVENGEKLIISEDVITTGKSSLETLKVIEDRGAEIVALCALVDRRDTDEDFILLENGRKLPVYSALKLHIKTYTPEECPLCKSGLKPVKPGSRKF